MPYKAYEIVSNSWQIADSYSYYRDLYCINQLSTSATTLHNYVPTSTWNETPILMSSNEAWRNWTAGIYTQQRDLAWGIWCNPGTSSATWTYNNPNDERVIERAREQRQRSEAARTRARSLLDSVLSDEQRRELAEHNRFHVLGSRGRLYRIRAQGQAGNVDVLGTDGQVVGTFCCHPSGVPDPDAWLAQMLAIQNDEDAFLRTANVHSGIRPADLAAA